MSEFSPTPEFLHAVRESRIFYRRRLALVLARTQLASSGGVAVTRVVAIANEITDELGKLEDAEATSEP